MNKVTVYPGGQKIEAKTGDNLRNVLIQNGFSIKSTCGGCASCGQCVVKITSGGENLTDIRFEEKQLLGNVYHITQERLSCQCEILGDLVVDISEHVDTPKFKPKTIIRKPKTGDEEQDEVTAEEAVKKVKEGGFKKPKAFKFDNTDKE